LRELRYGIALEQGQWRQALLLLQDIKAERVSLHSATSSQQMAAMQARYQVERMGSDNDVLREQLALNEHLMTRERRANTLLAIAAFVFLFLVVVLFFSARESLRAARRLRMKSAVVERQTQEIHTKNLELERQNMRLREALLGEEEKELMLKEIHHRVKNNLQIVDSLLQLQRSQSEVPGADRLFREAQGRIRSMALVHEQIYRAGELDRADPVGYLERLARNVVSSFGHMGDVRVDVHGSCPELPITTLIPLGLLVNELLTNSAKHAIGPGSTGAIGITIHEGSDGLLLEYTDGGGERSPGMREGGFGMQLVVALVEQLEGRLEDDGARSGCFRLVFHPVQNQLRKVG
jgi:two-component sensor histidine kinase